MLKPILPSAMTPDALESNRTESESEPTSEERSARPRRRGGRPKKTEATGRISRVHVLLTVAEKGRVREAARRGGLSISEYVRRRTLGRPVTSRVDADAERQLRRIGVNLNQLARVANAAGQVERGADLDVLVAEIRRAIGVLQGIESPPSEP